MSLPTIRRVITGHDAEGKAVVSEAALVQKQTRKI
jgi:hypothetical protein